MSEETRKIPEETGSVPKEGEIPVAEPEETLVVEAESVPEGDLSPTVEVTLVKEEQGAFEPEKAEEPEEKPRKKKRGYVRYSPFSLILLGVCAFVFSFSMYGLFEQNLLDAAGETEKENLSQIAFPDENGGGSDGSLIPDAIPNLNKWQEISVWKINANNLPFLRTVNFGSLKAENPDTVAWMYLPSTADVKGFPINLPVVQSTDNEHYLVRSFDGTYSDNGWVYADYRNNLANLRANRNLIFYGHARSYLIFGGLKYLNQQTRWQQDGYNQFIYVNTPTERTVWQIFSWYETTVDFNYISTAFSSDAEYVNFLRTLQDKNQIPVFKQFNFSSSDRILTLSTCKGSDVNARVAVHAVLVRHETANVENPPSWEGFPNTPSTDVPSTELPSDTGNVPDTSPGTDTGVITPPTVTDLPSTETVTPPSTDAETPSTETGTPPSSGTQTPPVSTDVPSGSGSTDVPSVESSGFSGSSLPDGDVSDGDAPSDSPLPETSQGSLSDVPAGGGTDGGNPSDTEVSSGGETSDGDDENSDEKSEEG